MLPSTLAIQAELSRRSLRAFLEYFAWPVLQPATPFKGNWHIDAICDHLEAVKRGEVKKLLVNMPFRMLKSTIISQTYPAWDWIDNPSREFLTASYAKDVATRDAVESRRIMESPKFRAAFGTCFEMAGDQNVKTRYENDKHGKRIITATGAAGTGFGGDVRIVDDPVSALDADSLVKIQESQEWWKGTMATRANDPETGAVIVVHQRLNSSDLTGYILEKEADTGWVHLVLPFRFDPKLTKTTSIGFHDPRTIPGELIHPERIGEEAASALEKTLGSYHKNAQLQQNPEPRGGVIFKREDWRYYKTLPTIHEITISVDATFKDALTSDHVAIQAWGWSHDRPADNFLLTGRIKERLGFTATANAVRAMAALHCAKVVAVLIEDKANGSAIIESLQSQVTGVIAIQPEGGKAARAFAMQPICEAGNMYLPDPEIEANIEVFIGTCARFTGAEGGDDDEVDSMTQYANWRRARNAQGGLAQYMKQQAEKRMAERGEAGKHENDARQAAIGQAADPANMLAVLMAQGQGRK